MIRTILAAAALAAIPVTAHAQVAARDPATIAPVATQTDHLTIVSTIGDGPPVILIPGLSSPRDVWDGVLPQLAKGHRVYLVQVRGFAGGDPGANLKPGILDGIVADLDKFITRNKFEKPVIIGHSMGGLVAMMLAKAHPGDVGKLMIVDTLPYIGDIFVPGATVTQIEPRAKTLRDAQIASYGKPADASAAEATATALARKPESRALLMKWIEQADPRVSGQAMYEDMTTDLRPVMADIATPITLVYPWSDKLPKERADAFYRAAYADAPNVTFVPVGDAAHFVMLDQPAAFAQAVDAFLGDE